MESFAKIIKGFQLLTIFTKHSILYVGQASEYASTHGRILTYYTPPKKNEANFLNCYKFRMEHPFFLLFFAKSELTYWLSNKKKFGARKCRWQYQSDANHGLMAKTRETGYITQLIKILFKFPQNPFISVNWCF